MIYVENFSVRNSAITKKNTVTNCCFLIRAYVTVDALLILYDFSRGGLNQIPGYKSVCEGD